MADRYIVQVNDGGWIDCVREDLLDAFLGDTTKLPVATFATLDAATQFITTMRGMMHCGGTDTAFRVLDGDDEGDVVYQDPAMPKPPFQRPAILPNWITTEDYEALNEDDRAIVQRYCRFLRVAPNDAAMLTLVAAIVSLESELSERLSSR